MAATATVVLVAPSVIVAVPATALVKLIVPDTVYWFVAELHVPGVAVTEMAQRAWHTGMVTGVVAEHDDEELN